MSNKEGNNDDKKRTNVDLNNDFVGAGFLRLDDALIQSNPPKIKWSHLYKDK